MRASFRGARLILHLCSGLLLALLITLDPSGRLAPDPITRWWNGKLLKILHVRLTIRGEAPAAPCLIVGNHISWLDIPVIASSGLTRFVSKAEVGRWPIAGWLANAAGTFYIRRGAGGTRQLIEGISRHLRRGGCVTVFPEGTTSDGAGMLKFQPRLFGAAIDSASPVQPVALRYGRAANGENIAAYIGEQSLVDNLFRLLQEAELMVDLNYCAPIQPLPGQDRSALARAAQAAVCAIVAPESLPATRAAAGGKSLAA